MAETREEVKPLGDLRKTLWWAGLSVVISLVTILVIFRLTKNENPFGELLRVSVGTLGIATVMVFISWLVDGLRLWVLARAMGGNVSFIEAVRISVAGAFMSGVTPSDTGGEPLKIYYLHRGGMSVGQATATITLIAMLHATTRFVLWLIVPLLAFALGFSIQFTPAIKATLTFGLLIYVIVMGLLVASTLWPEAVVRMAVWLFNTSFLKKHVSHGLLQKVEAGVRRMAEDFREGMLKFRSKGRHVVVALLLSILYWIVVISVPVVLLRRLGSNASPFQTFCLSMTVYLVMAYVPTPGSSGGAEVGSAIFFSPLLPAKVLGTFVVVWRAVTYYMTLFIGGALVVIDTLAHSYKKIKLQSQ